MTGQLFTATPAGRRLAASVRLILAACILPVGASAEEEVAEPRFVDLSLLVAPEYPCTWPTFPRFQINPYQRIGPLGPYNGDVLIIDGNTGTQLDVPPHSVTPPDSGLPNAGPFGRAFTDAIPAWQFGGEACVIDCRDLLDTAPPGHSSLVKKERVVAWEKAHRPLGPGDVVLFRSGYSDRYYRPLPEGRRFAADPVEGKVTRLARPRSRLHGVPGRPQGHDPGHRQHEHGAAARPGRADPLRRAQARHDLDRERDGLGDLPPTGAFFCMLGPKHAGGAFSEGRAFAVVGDPLARRLIDSARKKNVLDLSVVLADDLPVSWPGRGVGNHRQPYFRIRFGINPNTQTAFETHMLDSHAGTHLVPPSYALPPGSFDDTKSTPEVREWLAEYEAEFGPRGMSDATTEKVPISQSCGPSRIIDVAHLLGTSDRKRWPASPEITVADIRNYEERHGLLRPGDIAIFRSGWSDRYYRPFPEGKACMEDPLNGRSEGWPAPGPAAIFYLAQKGVRCVATDAPTLGGVEAKRALMTYWALGGKGMIGVEYLTNLGRMPEGAYFLFAAVKIRGCHGGPGRAIALY